jgi:hypothetical protein
MRLLHATEGTRRRHRPWRLGMRWVNRVGGMLGVFRMRLVIAVLSMGVRVTGEISHSALSFLPRWASRKSEGSRGAVSRSQSLLRLMTVILTSATLDFPRILATIDRSCERTSASTRISGDAFGCSVTNCT